MFFQSLSSKTVINTVGEIPDFYWVGILPILLALTGAVILKKIIHSQTKNPMARNTMIKLWSGIIGIVVLIVWTANPSAIAATGTVVSVMDGPKDTVFVNFKENLNKGFVLTGIENGTLTDSAVGKILNMTCFISRYDHESHSCVLVE